jgi:nicotinate-nucleotide adenylyltransferase
MLLRIGILTGTFDPVHLGHVELARAAMQSCRLDEVWFMVNPVPDHKQGTALVEHRRRMVELTLPERMRLYDGALSDRPHEPALFRSVMAEQAGGEFVFIVGEDTLVRIDTWKDVESVVTLASYAVARRHGTADDALDKLRVRLGPLSSCLRVQWFDFEDHGAASSLLIREDLRRGRVPRSLDPRVLDYIQTHHLYR